MNQDQIDAISSLMKQQLVVTDDRAHAVVCATAIELALREALDRRLVDGLSRKSIPLSQMAGLARGVGLISALEVSLIEAIAHIRNVLAHNLHTESYDDPAVQRHILKLRECLPLLDELQQLALDPALVLESLKGMPRDVEQLLLRQSAPTRWCVSQVTTIVANQLIGSLHTIERIEAAGEIHVVINQGKRIERDGRETPLYGFGFSRETTDSVNTNSA